MLPGSARGGLFLPFRKGVSPRRPRAGEGAARTRRGANKKGGTRQRCGLNPGVATGPGSVAGARRGECGAWQATQ